ncbi:unnamed protein product [Anisakis simplex]|uniref:Uncharacterized protein n=1 Tax=Anisakis simplex TaxID=6269 RepID=A0A0M3JEA9_ANISI|nr:unnamed protein product [Anisakis simplex]
MSGIFSEENVSGDGSTLSATSGTDSPTADDTGYWGLTSSATRSMAEFASLSQLSPHVRTHPVIVTPTSIHSYPPEHHVARVTSEIRFFQPDENNDESIEDIDNDDQTLVEQPVRSSVKSIVAKWPPRGPKESFA